MKFTRPLYRDLMKSSAPGAAKAARETFARQVRLSVRALGTAWQVAVACNAYGLAGGGCLHDGDIMPYHAVACIMALACIMPISACSIPTRALACHVLALLHLTCAHDLRARC